MIDIPERMDIEQAMALFRSIDEADEDARDPYDCFAVAQGIYWFCAHYHDGRWSAEYATMCELGYRPALTESEPDMEEAWAVYEALEAEYQTSG